MTSCFVWPVIIIAIIDFSIFFNHFDNSSFFSFSYQIDNITTKSTRTISTTLSIIQSRNNNSVKYSLTIFFLAFHHNPSPFSSSFLFTTFSQLMNHLNFPKFFQINMKS